MESKNIIIDMEERFLSVADLLRAKILSKIFLSSRVLKHLYSNKDLRLVVLSTTVFLAVMISSIFFPLAVIICTPFLYGLPHIISGFNIIKKPSFLETSKYAQVSLCLVFLSYFIYKFNFYNLKLDIIFPALIIVISFFLAPRKSFSSFILISFLFTSLYFFQSSIIFLLIWLHNFIAFIYLILKSIPKKKISVAIYTTTLFLLGNILILFFDVDQSSPSQSFFQNIFSLEAFSNSIGIFEVKNISMLKFASLYAFGQTMHYFVWLKLIPEIMNKKDSSLSFKKYFKNNFLKVGRPFAYGIFLLALLLMGYIVIAGYKEARIAYFSLIAYHGFFEILSLPNEFKDLKRQKIY